MQNSEDVLEKENALKFFLEICHLLKSIQLNHRFPFQCNRELTKLMIVLAQTFNIMIPNQKLLQAALDKDIEAQIKLYSEESDD